MSMQHSTRKRHAVMAATVATALVALLFLVLSAVSANAGAVTATISEDTDASATRCDHEIRSDSTCDLILRVFNTTSGERTWTLDKILVDKAFDASTITPQTGTPGTMKTLGQCPCQYPIAANANQTYKIHIEVGVLRDGYTGGKINVYPSAYNGGQFPPSTVASYRLDIEIATSITINTVTDTTINLSWVGNVFATRAFIFWWPEGGTFDSVTPMTTKDSTYTITGLTPATKYLVRVQPYKSLTKYQAKQVEVTTRASTASAAQRAAPRCHPQTKQLGAITIASVGAETWCKVKPAYYRDPFDHAMAIGESLTYEISVAAESCPATVQIRGNPRWRWGGTDNSKLMGIAHGSTAPSPRVASAYNSLTLAFSGAACTTPQRVTVFGTPDPTGRHRGAGRVSILHTLTQRAGQAANEAGPKLAVWAIEARDIDLRMGVPSSTGHTVNHGHHDSEGRWTHQPFLNNVGRPVDVGKKTNHAGQHAFWPITYVRAQRPSTGNTAPAYTEFCVYVHPREIPDLNEAGEMVLPVHGSYRSPERQLTLIPFTHQVLHWQHFGDKKLRRSADTGFKLPFEIQRYTSVVNRNGACQPVGSDNSGVWETVYSGGPTVNTSAAQTTWETTTRDSVVPFVIQHQDYGQYINVRIRGVYGVSTRTDTQGQFLNPPGRALNVKFTFAEAPTERSWGSFELTFFN